MEINRKSKQNSLAHCKSINNFFNNNQAPNNQEINLNQSAFPQRISRQSDKAKVHHTTFNFDNIERNTCKEEYPERIHAKMSTKREGGKVVLISRKSKNQEKKENEPNLIKCQQRGKTTFRNSIKEDSQQAQENFISIKSYQTDRFSCSSSSLSNSRNLANQTVRPQGEAEEIFREVRRRLEGDLQYSRKMEKKKKCFYTILKEKLQKEVRKTAQQKKRDHMTFLIEGCHAVQHCKITQKDYLQTADTEPIRPQTVTPKTCRTTLTLANKENRPKSCRSTTALQSPRYFKDIKNKSEKVMSKAIKQRASARPRPNTGKYRSCNSPSFSNSHRNSTPAESSLQETSSKLTQIINNCHNEQLFGDLKLNMKTFEFYCKKLSEGFQKAERRIEDIQCMEID